MLKRERWLYAVIAAVITASVFYGFSTTYLPPSTPAPDLPASVHIHGISFLAWYALLLAQSLLVAFGKVGWHRSIGIAGLLLALVMLASGWLVIVVNMARGLDGDPFWSTSALVIFSNLLLFGGFFFAAIRYRNNGALHRRLMVAAAAAGSGAAQFRTMVELLGFGSYTISTSILLTNAFIALALIADRLVLGKWHRVHFWTFGIAVLLESAMLVLATTGAGVALQQALVDISQPIMGLY